jgi:hypothetical protein
MAKRVLPIPDARAQFRRAWEVRMRKFWKRGPGGARGLDDGGVPVANKPLNLSGGAAAALEFDD